MPAYPRYATIAEYNAAISIPPPRLKYFDVRDFAQNMKSVHLRVPPFRLPFVQVALLETGSGRVSGDGTDFDLRNCTLWFNLPEQITYWDIERDWRGYYVSLCEEFYTDRPADYGSLRNWPFFRQRHDGIHLERGEALHLLETFRRIHRKYQEPDQPHYVLQLRAEVNVLLSECLTVYTRSVDRTSAKRAQQGPARRYADLVAEYVANLSLGLGKGPQRPADFARALYVSPGYLAECTRRELDRTPTELLHERLIREATKLLGATDLPVAEIADLLAFSSVAYFSRVFRKYRGQSPSQYRSSC